MKNSKEKYISLDSFINKALYDKKKGYYSKKDPFGKSGDFITSPNISIMFSEMIAIWCIAFWENLGRPKKINLVELGGGNGEMIYRMIKVFKKFNKFNESCNFYMHEKSSLLKNIQKKKLFSYKIKWINSLSEIKNGPNIFLANEFFDSLPIKQFIKKKNKWFEKKIKSSHPQNYKFIDTITNIKKLEKNVGINLSANQKIIEFSPLSYKYLNTISKKINIFKGGLLILDYGYFEKKMKNTLQSVYKHKFNNIFHNLGNADITYSINFYLIKNIVNKLKLKVAGLTTQGEFLTRLGILQRAEILAKNLVFSKKSDIYYRLNRLINDSQMGKIFKVMFITTKKNRFKLGFKN